MERLDIVVGRTVDKLERIEKFALGRFSVVLVGRMSKISELEQCSDRNN